MSLEKFDLAGWLTYLGLDDVSPETLARKESADDILRRVRELSEGRAENRTLIYIELRKISCDVTARIILDLMEPVTQGEKSWTTFQIELRELLKEE